MKRIPGLLLLLSVPGLPAHAGIFDWLTKKAPAPAAEQATASPAAEGEIILSQGEFRHVLALTTAEDFEVLNTLGKLNFATSDGSELVLRGTLTGKKPLKLEVSTPRDGARRIEVKYPSESSIPGVRVSGGNVSIKNVNGARNVSIVSINGKTTVKINGKVVTSSESDSSGFVDLTLEIPKGMLRDLVADADEIQMREFRDGVVRATRFEFRSSLNIINLDSSEGVAINTLSGETNVVGLLGDVQVDSTSGDVTLTGIGQAGVETLSGSIRVDSAKAAILNSTSGDISANQIAGDLQMSSLSGTVKGTGIAGSVGISVTNGDVVLKNVKRDAGIQTLSGEVDAKEIEGNLQINTTSGDVRSSQVRGHIAVTTLSGEIRFANPDALSENAETSSGEIRGKTKAASQFKVQEPKFSGLCIRNLTRR